MVCFVIAAAWLAQLIENWTAVRGSRVRAPDRTNTRGLQITEDNMLPLKLYLQMVRSSRIRTINRRPVDVMVSRGRKRTHMGIVKSRA